MNLETILMTAIAAVFNAIAFMVGMRLGTKASANEAEKRVMKMLNKSSTVTRLTKLLEKSDELFGDDQLVEQVTKFFKEASDLVSSNEARNFFKNVSTALIELSTEQKVDLELPKKPKGST